MANTDYKRHRRRLSIHQPWESTHRDTTILSSLDFCYMFLHKRSCQVVVSAGQKTITKRHDCMLQLDVTTHQFNQVRLTTGRMNWSLCPSCGIWSEKANTVQRVKVLTFSLQLDNMLIMLRQTDCTERAGDQSSVRMDRQMWPLLYTWGWTGTLSPVNITWNKDTPVTLRQIIPKALHTKKEHLRQYTHFQFGGGGMGPFESEEPRPVSWPSNRQDVLLCDAHSDRRLPEVNRKDIDH